MSVTFCPAGPPPGRVSEAVPEVNCLSGPPRAAAAFWDLLTAELLPTAALACVALVVLEPAASRPFAGTVVEETAGVGPHDSCGFRKGALGL